MSHEKSAPDFNEFARWMASQFESKTLASPSMSERYGKLLASARVARNEVIEAAEALRSPAAATGGGRRHLEVLQLLAAADKSDLSRPPELVTPRGFHVTLAYDEGGGPDASSICVLVRCPPELIQAIQGETAYLWNGPERFELGQYDSEGKAIGTLPAGIEISLADFTAGKVQLEEPAPSIEG
jgi:hypothetical protein